MDLQKQPAAEPAAPPAGRAPGRTPGQAPEGCLVVAIRLPVRIVVLVLVVPVRMVWDGLVVVGRLLRDAVLRPLGRALSWLGKALFVRPLIGLWRYAVVPAAKALAWLGKVLVVTPVVWLCRYLLTPLGHGLAWLVRGVGAGFGWLYARVLTPVGHAVLRLLHGIGGVIAAVGVGLYGAGAWLVRYLVVVPARWVHRWFLTPVGRAIGWCARGAWRFVELLAGGIGLVLYWAARILLVLPALALWRWVLVPVGRFLAVVAREVADALGHAWRIAGRVSLAVGRFLGTLLRWTLVEPVRWAYRTVLTPVGHVVRDAVLRPAGRAARSVGRASRQALAAAWETARQTRADVRRMLFGEPVRREAAVGREPSAGEARTLGSSTTALTKD
ncbi:hypothetical protein ACIA8I_17995 [Streptomyces rishiriensis]|uniref:hypothetical protein n=1 Tax=Streptomyces rishiriensis TaxID=68264 RepID=UPI00378EB805